MLTSLQQLQGFYGGEKDVMGLDCEAFDWRSISTSSYDAGVATGVDVNFDAFNLTRDKLIQEGWTMSQFTHFSPSPIPQAKEIVSFDVNLDKCSPVTQREYYDQRRGKLTEEDYYAREDFYNPYYCSSPSEEKKYAFSKSLIPLSDSDSSSDICYQYSEEEEYKEKDGDSYHYSEEDECNSDEDGDEEDEEEDEEEEDEESRAENQKRPADKQKLEVWVDSWKGKNRETLFAWVNVYAYYNKHKSYGGYGVILRDLHAKPITASAKFSADGKSFFTQVLMGMKAGLTLAKKHGCLKFCIECNSIKVPDLICHLWQCCNVVSDDSYACKSCNVVFTQSMGCDLSLVPLMREIKALSQHLGGLFGYPRNANKAAHYVAKMGKKKRHNLENKEERTDPDAKMGKRKRPNLENKEERTDPGDEELAETDLGDFPQELKDILWEDAFGEFVCYNQKGGY